MRGHGCEGFGKGSGEGEERRSGKVNDERRAGGGRTADPRAVTGVAARVVGTGAWLVAELQREKRRTSALDPCRFSRINETVRSYRRSCSAGNSSRTAATWSGSISAVTVVGSSPADASVVPHGS